MVTIICSTALLMELCHYIPSCPCFFRSRTPSCLPRYRDNVCLACCVSKGDRHTGFLLSLFYTLFSVSNLPFFWSPTSILCHPFTLMTFPSSFTLMGKKRKKKKKAASYLVMRELCLLQSQRGLIKQLCAVIENTTQRLVADSCCACVSTCVKAFLLLRRSLCVFK